jgi:hypothetical protein
MGNAYLVPNQPNYSNLVYNTSNMRKGGMEISSCLLLLLH